jgi:hypothetical protein
MCVLLRGSRSRWMDINVCVQQRYSGDDMEVEFNRVDLDCIHYVKGRAGLKSRLTQQAIRRT